MQTPILVPVAKIKIGDRIRPVGDVSDLKESLAALGLRTPITVRFKGKTPYVVAGARRLTAIKELKLMDEVPAFVEEDGTEEDAEAWEIAENLHRLDLTPAQRKDHVKRYVAALGAKMAKENPGVDPTTGGKGKKGVVSQAAKDLKLSKQRVHQILNEDKPKKPKEPPATEAPVALPGHTSSKARPPANEVEAAGLVTEGNTEDGHKDEDPKPTPAPAPAAKPKKAAKGKDPETCLEAWIAWVNKAVSSRGLDPVALQCQAVAHALVALHKGKWPDEFAGKGR